LRAALWLVAAVALAEPGAANGAEPAARPLGEQEILIFQPLETRTTPDPESLLKVPAGTTCLFVPRSSHPWGCGFLYRFEVEVSAFSAIQWIAINGRVLARPNDTWVRAQQWVVATPGGTTVEVEAATASRTARNTFVVRVPGVKLPGTPFFIDPSAP
jgi:hypothetical protein